MSILAAAPILEAISILLGVLVSGTAIMDLLTSRKHAKSVASDLSELDEWKSFEADGLKKILRNHKIGDSEWQQIFDAVERASSSKSNPLGSRIALEFGAKTPKAKKLFLNEIISKSLQKSSHVLSE